MKSLEPGGFNAESYQTYRCTITNTLQIIPQIETEGTLPNSFYEVSVTLIAKTQRHYQERELQTNLIHEY